LSYYIQGAARKSFTKSLKLSAEENNIKLILQTIRIFRVPLIIFLFLYLLIVFTHRFWLPLAADFLVIQNLPHQADLIVVATPFRPRFLNALSLFQQGFAKQILLVGDHRIKTLQDGKTTSELAKQEAINRGIPISKIHVKHSTGTRTDALQAKTLMSSLGLKSALVISDPYNMRRLSIIFKNIFKDSGMILYLAPTKQKRKTPDFWWLSPHTFIYVAKEWIKLPINYYLLSTITTKDIELPKEPIEQISEKFIEPSNDFFSGNFLQKLSRLINFKIGEFLIIDHKEINSDIVLTPKISERVLSCYMERICKKIFLFSGGSNYLRDPKEIQARAKKLGVNLGDLTIVPYALEDAYQTTKFLNKFMKENRLKTANIFLPYYKTRKFQFYFKRYLNSAFTIQLNPLESKYRHLLEQWRYNAGLANLYLDQYLYMTHYYFNEILWTSD
jgi:uncharacterized SAM-binding protein YcdF (DUF218 family)